MTTNVISVLDVHGSNNSTCGYCSPPGERSSEKSSYSLGVTAVQLSCQVYQRMLDRGWRRSGDYLYKPNMRRSCCPAYTIRLEALKFSPSKSQRKVLSRFNRFIIHGQDRGSPDGGKSGNLSSKGGNSLGTSSLASVLHSSEHGIAQTGEGIAHALEVTLEPASFTREKYELFEKYQRCVHNDTNSSPAGFERFLVTTTLQPEPIRYDQGTQIEHLPARYGSYHQLYRLDGVLIAMAVLDILPNCVSSVYFMYDPVWDFLSLGKVSALREASLACEMHEAGAQDMEYLYMGFYIHSCQKMRYKGEYSPSFLLDPEDYTWHPMSSCIPLLDSHRYACFSSPERSIPRGAVGSEEGEAQVAEQELEQVMIIQSMTDSVVKVEPITRSRAWRRPALRKAIVEVVNGLGDELSKEIILGVFKRG